MLTSSKRFGNANSYEIFSLRRVNFLHVLHASRPQCFGKASITRINRSTERFIGRLKLIVNDMVRDDLQNFDKTDLRILVTLLNVA